jgi:dihydropyrimidinase
LRRPGFEGAKYVLTPPLRGHEDQGALWDALADRTLQVVSTDHCPFFYHGQKDRDATSFVAIPNGGPGIEHRLQLLYHHGVNGGRFPVTRWVDLVSTTPAKMFGLFPRKGTIAVGSDADMVIWNPRAPVTISSATHHMNVDYSLFEGFRVTGNAETVVSRGEMIVHDGTWLGRRGRGQFIKRDAFEPSRLRSPEMRVSSPG